MQRSKHWALCKPMWQLCKFSLTGLNMWAALQQQVEMMGEGKAFSHQTTAVVFKGLVIPGYRGVSRTPPLH